MTRERAARRDTAPTGSGLSARSVTTAALLAALLTASALPAVRLGPVPFTLQMFCVVLAALLLSPGQAALATGVYLLEGAAGLPVFAGLLGGIGVLAGPTGGYLWGFLCGATCGAWLRGALAGRVSPLVSDAAAAAATVAVVYALGAIQLALVAHLDAGGALTAGVLPFVWLDAVKATVAIGVAAAVRRALPNGAPRQRTRGSVSGR